eukprot:scaffold361_cov248-Pinguiococcus_pyrenoidosus.AAC.21
MCAASWPGRSSRLGIAQTGVTTPCCCRYVWTRKSSGWSCCLVTKAFTSSTYAQICPLRHARSSLTRYAESGHWVTSIPKSRRSAASSSGLSRLGKLPSTSTGCDSIGVPAAPSDTKVTAKATRIPTGYPRMTRVGSLTTKQS